jgi:hypothetical protein
LGRPHFRSTSGRLSGPRAVGGPEGALVVHQSYMGPVLIRSRRLGGWAWMRFDRGSRPEAEIRIAPRETVLWRRQPAGRVGVVCLLPSAGCYAAQIDGTSFSEVIVFRVLGLR